MKTRLNQKERSPEEVIEVLSKSYDALERKLSLSIAKTAQLVEDNIRLKEEKEKYDKELDIVHECLTELYEYDLVYPIVIKCLDRIEKEIGTTKHNNLNNQ